MYHTGGHSQFLAQGTKRSLETRVFILQDTIAILLEYRKSRVFALRQKVFEKTFRMASGGGLRL